MTVHYLNPKDNEQVTVAVCGERLKESSFFADGVTCEECKETKEYQMGLLFRHDEVIEFLLEGFTA